MKILGMETSCDETAAAVIEDGRRILSNVVASQIAIHARFGGVVPEVASRQHLRDIIPVVQQALQEARVNWPDLGAVAVTMGPGLAGSLLVGVNMAKSLALGKGLPLVGVNHLEGHIYANWLVGQYHEVGREEGSIDDPPSFPVLCLVVSGGHTDLILMSDHGQYTLVGSTRDDAAGEAFDKVARILGLGFPGGPAIQEIAKKAPAPKITLTRPWLKGSDDFSFSGIKTAVLRLAEEKGIYRKEAGQVVDSAHGGSRSPGREESPQDKALIAELAAAFQQALVDVLVTKTLRVADRYGVNQILLSGGVAANELLRQTFVEKSHIPLRFPKPKFCTDNAAMIASCGYYRLQAGSIAGWDIDVNPGLRLGQ